MNTMTSHYVLNLKPMTIGEDLVANYDKTTKFFLFRNYRLIVAHENLLFLKQIFAREEKLWSSANMQNN